MSLVLIALGGDPPFDRMWINTDHIVTIRPREWWRFAPDSEEWRGCDIELMGGKRIELDISPYRLIEQIEQAGG